MRAVEERLADFTVPADTSETVVADAVRRGRSNRRRRRRAGAAVGAAAAVAVVGLVSSSLSGTGSEEPVTAAAEDGTSVFLAGEVGLRHISGVGWDVFVPETWTTGKGTINCGGAAVEAVIVGPSPQPEVSSIFDGCDPKLASDVVGVYMLRGSGDGLFDEDEESPPTVSSALGVRSGFLDGSWLAVGRLPGAVGVDVAAALAIASPSALVEGPAVTGADAPGVDSDRAELRDVPGDVGPLVPGQQTGQLRFAGSNVSVGASGWESTTLRFEDRPERSPAFTRTLRVCESRGSALTSCDGPGQGDVSVDVGGYLWSCSDTMTCRTEIASGTLVMDLSEGVFTFSEVDAVLRSLSR